MAHPIAMNVNIPGLGEYVLKISAKADETVEMKEKRMARITELMEQEEAKFEAMRMAAHAKAKKLMEAGPRYLSAALVEAIAAAKESSPGPRSPFYSHPKVQKPESIYFNADGSFGINRAAPKKKM